MAQFLSWKVTSLRSLGDGPVVRGRLRANVPIDLAEITGNATGGTTGPFELFGPGDVARLAPGAISRRYPSPGATDAEESKRPLVEFAGQALLDLPWRYSPDPIAAGQLRPWLVLVVGETPEVPRLSGGRILLSQAVQSKHPLADSANWAHVHELDEVGREAFARILCPRDLAPATAYTACLVPAFALEADGTLRDAWPVTAGGPVTLPCYDAWSFRTGEAGDFHEIAARLRATTATLLGPDFGRARLRYDRRGPSNPSRESLATAGALRRPLAEEEDPVPPWIATETAALSDEIPTPDGRWVLTAPRYPAPFTLTADEPDSGWGAALTTDPRRRGAAGLGAWAGIEWQDRIATAASTKAGDLAIARDRVAHLALGLEASRSLWRRHVPEDPVARLALLGPVLARLPAESGGTVRDAIAGRTPLMAGALWSSAARRALRPGPARTARAAPGAARFEAILAIVARCPVPVRDPENVPLKGGADAETQIAAATKAIETTAPDRGLADAIVRRLFRFGAPADPQRLAALLAALQPGGKRQVSRRWIALLLMIPRRSFDTADLFALEGALAKLAGRSEPCREFSPEKLGEIVAAAVDPTAARPVVVDRVLGTLTGVTDIGPIEIEPELDLPLFRFLADRAPDWLLPGIGDLAEDRVVALATNPAFVEAFLVGANHQATAELRWRDMPIAARWSPLRKFWQRAGGKLDINPIRSWPMPALLGEPALAPADVTGIEAVVVFRTPLFRRYPATVVYLYRDSDWTLPENDTPLLEVDKQYPSFTGRIGPEVTFFGFPVPPEELAHYWIVLEEPPAGYRFYSTKTVDKVPVPAPPGAVANAAEYASATFAPPVRVMIGRLMGNL